MKNVFSILLLAFVGTVSAQTGPDVIVDAKGNREIEPAFRVTEAPKIIDTVKATKVASYPFLVYQAPTKIFLDTIEAASVETKEKLQQLYPFYVKVGMGSVLMPLGELYFNSTRSRAYNYGLHVKHLSSFGDVKDRNKITYAPAQFDNTDLSLFGKINQSNYNLAGAFNYKNNGFHYYGIPVDSIPKDSIAQRYQQLGGNIDFTGNRGDTTTLNYKLGAAYNFFDTKKPQPDSLAIWRVREHNFKFNSRLWYLNKSETFYGDLGVRYNGYRYGIADSVRTPSDSGLVTNNTIIDFRPGVLSRFLDNKLKVDVGLQLSVDIHQKTKVYVYPMIDFQLSLFNDIFIPYLGVRGGLTQNTYRSLSTINPFLVSMMYLQNEHNPYEAFGGFKGTLTKRLSFNIGASFGRYLNKAFFINDSLQMNKFTLVYDTVNITRIEGSMSYQMNEKLKIDGIGRFYSYQTKNQAFAWNMPQLQFVLRGSYNLYDKFLLKIDGLLESGRKALVYAPGTGVLQENGQYYKNLGFIADFNLGFEYRYNPRVSAFIQFNNLAAQRYNRWYNYPVLPFQVLGGITARF